MKTREPLRAIRADCTGESPGIQPVIAAGRTVMVKDQVPAPRDFTTGAGKVISKICASEITVTLFGGVLNSERVQRRSTFALYAASNLLPYGDVDSAPCCS
jgi:hypothetical protein